MACRLSPHFTLFSLVYAVYAVTEDRLECRLAHEFIGNGIPGFGCSDCACPSHLFYRRDDPMDEILTAFRSLGLTPVTKTIINAQVKDNI